MPNKHAAIKDLRKNRKRAARNARIRTHMKALQHQFTKLMAEGKSKEAAELVKKIQQAVDKAAKRHVVHTNKARRQVSKAHRKIAKTK